ncbi:MAG: GTPase HflX [bacterium]|nr:GTPase HflX [bacterium]
MKERGILAALFPKSASLRRIERSIEELTDLSRSISVEIVETIVQRIGEVSPSTYMGAGKVVELKEAAKKLNATTLIISNEISPMQLRNLEKMLSMKVIDRNELILSIFAKNASSNISMAEVELAQYRYMLPRLSGKGVMMSRLGGGIGTRGPGETKLETDRRHIEKKIDSLKKKLEQYKKNSEVRSKNRANAFSVCLIGYTNAGKTKLMNSLVSEGFVSDDKLFTTLDTVTRKLSRSIVLTDTVGFLGGLPHEIIKSFEITIDEAARADLKLIVIDISDKYVHETVDDLHKIMEELKLNSNKKIYVFNKTDILVNHSLINEFAETFPDAVFISAKTKDNVSVLREKIMNEFYSTMDHFNIVINPSMAKAVSFINANGHIIKQKIEKENLKIEFYISKKLTQKMKREYGGLFK